LRGQVILTDLAISIALGVTMLFVVQSQFQPVLRSPDQEAFVISEQLISSRGIPDDWTYENVVSPGLALRRGDLDPAKLEEIRRMPKERLKRLFNSKYGITIMLDGAVVGNSSIGTNNYPFTRYITVSGEPHALGVVLSEE